MSKERTIKKYPNRRLYDTAASQYIALEDIRRLVVDGVDFRVVDAKRDKDITRAILLQIIVEREEHGQPILSADLLRKIIRFYGDAMQVLMASYLDKSVDWFIDQQSALYQQMENLMGQAPGAAFQEMVGRNLELWQQMQEGLLKAYGFPARPKGREDFKDKKDSKDK